MGGRRLRAPPAEADPSGRSCHERDVLRDEAGIAVAGDAEEQLVQLGTALRVERGEELVLDPLRERPQLLERPLSVRGQADEVSAAIAGLFGAAGQEWQSLAVQAQAFQDQFVQTMTAAASAYQAAETANTHVVGLGENLISLQPEGVSSSIPLDVLLHFTNSRWPVVRFVDSALLRAFYPGYGL